MSKQECKVRPAMININSNKPSFYKPSVVIILIVHMVNYAFLMLWKKWMLNYLN